MDQHDMSEDSTQSSEVEQSQESGIESLEHSFHPQKNEIVELIPETRRSTTSRRFGSTSSTESYEDLLDELQELLDPNRLHHIAFRSPTSSVAHLNLQCESL